MGMQRGLASSYSKLWKKYLMASLLAKGWRLKKIHTLPSLLDEAEEINGVRLLFR